MIAAGYEDANDATRLRLDPVFKMALERLPSGRDLCSQSTILCLSFRCDQHVVGSGFAGDDDPEQRSEGGVSGAAAVETEDERVEVGLHMLLAQTMVYVPKGRCLRFKNIRWPQGSTTWAAIGPMTCGSWVTPGAPS